MRILFAWTGVTSYMADCWRRLQQESDVELKVVVECAEIGKEFDKGRVLQSLDTCIVGDLSSERQKNRPVDQVETWLNGWKPEVLFAVGWHSKAVRALVTKQEWKDVPKVCCFDLPWRWKPRCIAARFVLGPFLRHYAAAYVPGRACERYARWLGFKKIWKGLFSISVRKFESLKVREFESLKVREFESLVAPSRPQTLKPSHPQTLKPSHPQTLKPLSGFLFVGRHAPEKGLDTLKSAYEIYRQRGGAWPLSVPEWIEPEDVPRVMREHACLVLPSRWEPWGVVVAEAKAAGMRVIVSDQVHAREDLACDAVFKAGDAAGLAEKMLEMERTKAGEVPDMGFWSCEAWVKRVRTMFGSLVSGA